MEITDFRLGEPWPTRGLRPLRVLVTRFPPRGVAVELRAVRGNFDVWFPLLAPSPRLLRFAVSRGLEDEHNRARFFARYERELLATAETRGALDLISAMAMSMPVAVGCFCADRRSCHRTALVAVLLRRYGRKGGA